MRTRTFTAEDMERAKLQRQANIEAGAKYRRDWLDAPAWDQLAKEHGFRLPAWWVAPTPQALRRWWKRTQKGRVETPFAFAYGCSPSRLIELNPAMPLRAFVGQMLERGL